MFANRFWGVQSVMKNESEGGEDLDVSLPDDKEVLEEEEEVKEEDKEEKEEEEEELDDEGNPKEKAEKEEKEEEEELVRLSYQDLKAALKDKPELFKAAKVAFFREQEFTKRFPSIEDADTALEAAEAYDGVKNLVMSGNAESFLEQVAEASPKALKTFVENFLPALNNLSKDTYIAVTRPVVENIIRTMYKHGEKRNDKNIMNAAKIFNNEVFGDYEIGDEPKDRPKTEEDEDFNKEKQEFYGKKQMEVQNSVAAEIEADLVKSIEKGLDPTNSIRPGLKKILLEKIKSEVDRQVAADENHMARMRSLWQREARNGFSGALKGSIKTAYLSRANALIPQISKRVRAEVLDTQLEDDKRKSDKLDKTKRLQAGESSRSSSKQLTAKEARDKNMSDKDILASIK